MIEKMETVFERIKKYNVWDNKKLPVGFIRKNKLNQIQKFLNNKLIKVITGQRRSGKSYLMRQLINYLIEEQNVSPQNIFYLNKEYLVFDEIKTATNLSAIFEYYKKQLNPKGKVYIFVDEIQNIQHWEKFANSYSQDYSSEYELFITGSNSNLLSGELATLLSGRYVEFEVFPFSFDEYCEYSQLKGSRKTFLKYIRTGGLPEMFHFKEEELLRNYVESLKNTIVLRDIVQRNKVKDVGLLQDVFKFMLTNTGNLTAVSTIIKYFKNKQKKTNYETISSYISYLSDTFIIHEAERFNLRGKQTLGGERKYYINDMAFKTYLLGFYPEDISAYLENYVYIQLRRMGFQVFVGVLRNGEIDFVAQKNNLIRYFQVAYELGNPKTIQREYGNLMQIKDNFPKYVVSLDEHKYSEKEGIKHLWPWELNNGNLL